MKLPDAPHELGITFVATELDQLRRLEQELDTVADGLQVDRQALVLPEKGFISQPLDSVQQTALTDLLDPFYSVEFTALQDTAQQLQINESGERMTSMVEAFKQHGLLASFVSIDVDAKAGSLAGDFPKVFFARETVVAKHTRLAEALGAIGVHLRFEDCFRPLGVQEAMFQNSIDEAHKAHPDYDAATLLAQARSKVAFAPFLAGHKGGAATDLSLIDTASNTRLDTGHEYADHGACVILDFPFLTFEQFRARQLFAQATTMAGLTVYPGEDWHVSSGDVGAAIASDDPKSYEVKYGPIKNFDPKTGEIDPYDPDEIRQPFNFTLPK